MRCVQKLSAIGFLFLRMRNHFTTILTLTILFSEDEIKPEEVDNYFYDALSKCDDELNLDDEDEI